MKDIEEVYILAVESATLSNKQIKKIKKIIKKADLDTLLSISADLTVDISEEEFINENVCKKICNMVNERLESADYLN